MPTTIPDITESPISLDKNVVEEVQEKYPDYDIEPIWREMQEARAWGDFLPEEEEEEELSFDF